MKDAYQVLGKGKPTRDTLERLVDKGWLERLEKGKYLIVPLEAGPDRTWTEDASAGAAPDRDSVAGGFLTGSGLADVGTYPTQ